MGRDGRRRRSDIYLNCLDASRRYEYDAILNVKTPVGKEPNVLVWEMKYRGDLFCGDLLKNMDKPARTTIVDDSAELDASVEKLRTLEIKTVYPGHGKPFRMEQFMENN